MMTFSVYKTAFVDPWLDIGLHDYAAGLIWGYYLLSRDDQSAVALACWCEVREKAGRVVPDSFKVKYV